MRGTASVTVSFPVMRCIAALLVGVRIKINFF
jgi:hypothetical protein